MIDLARIVGFDWDAGNARKNEKHGVSMAGAEQAFFNAPLLMIEDTKHSVGEPLATSVGRWGWLLGWRKA